MKLEGFEATQRALVRAPVLVKNLSSSAVATTTFAVGQRAKSLVRVGETGNLKAAIEASRPTAGGLTGRVGTNATNVYYWRFVEFGAAAINQKARPFFRPAAEAESNAYTERMRAIGPRLERDFAVGRTL